MSIILPKGSKIYSTLQLAFNYSLLLNQLKHVPIETLTLRQYLLRPLRLSSPINHFRRQILWTTRILMESGIARLLAIHALVSNRTLVTINHG